MVSQIVARLVNGVLAEVKNRSRQHCVRFAFFQGLAQMIERTRAPRGNDRNGHRLSGALAACLVYQVVLHSLYVVYWESVFAYTLHSFFMVIGLMASLMARVRPMS